MKFLAIIFFCLISIFWYYISWKYLKENDYINQKEVITAILVAWNFIFWFLLAKLIYKNKDLFKEEKKEDTLEKLKWEDFFVPEIKEIEEEHPEIYEKDKNLTKDNIDVILDEREENYKHKINLKEEILKKEYKNLLKKSENQVDIIDKTFENVANNLKKKSKQNLQIIEWIWPKIEELLNSNWIYSYKDLKNTDVDKLKDILEKANKRYTKLHNPSTWPKQASIADLWNFDELKKYQEKLIKWIEK